MIVISKLFNLPVKQIYVTALITFLRVKKMFLLVQQTDFLFIFYTKLSTALHQVSPMIAVKIHTQLRLQ